MTCCGGCLRAAQSGQRSPPEQPSVTGLLQLLDKVAQRKSYLSLARNRAGGVPPMATAPQRTACSQPPVASSARARQWTSTISTTCLFEADIPRLRDHRSGVLLVTQPRQSRHTEPCAHTYTSEPSARRCAAATRVSSGNWRYGVGDAISRTARDNALTLITCRKRANGRRAPQSGKQVPASRNQSRPAVRPYMTASLVRKSTV
jgi:hypothetical protein